MKKSVGMNKKLIFGLVVLVFVMVFLSLNVVSAVSVNWNIYDSRHYVNLSICGEGKINYASVPGSIHSSCKDMAGLVVSVYPVYGSYRNNYHPVWLSAPGPGGYCTTQLEANSNGKVLAKNLGIYNSDGICDLNPSIVVYDRSYLGAHIYTQPNESIEEGSWCWKAPLSSDTLRILLSGGSGVYDYRMDDVSSYDGLAWL